jgi:hypothetical protein
MHYIKFLKLPVLVRPLKRKTKDLQLKTKITITNDLGEQLLLVDLKIRVTIRGPWAKVIIKEYQWKAGNESGLDIEVDIPPLMKDSCRILIEHDDGNTHSGLQFMVSHNNGSDLCPQVRPIRSDEVRFPADNELSGRVERPLYFGPKEPFTIWEERGTSIARHIW